MRHKKVSNPKYRLEDVGLIENKHIDGMLYKDQLTPWSVVYNESSIIELDPNQFKTAKIELTLSKMLGIPADELNRAKIKFDIIRRRTDIGLVKYAKIVCPLNGYRTGVDL